jgi:GMP synthase (glutamine-hydrolysing)
MSAVLALRHVPFEDLGYFESVLADRGLGVRYVDAVTDDLAVIDAVRPDLVVVLGGPIGAYEDAAYPFLGDELRLIEHRLRANRPTLGICLGAQLIARALGARVHPGSVKEIGWAPLTLTEAGKRSPLRFIAQGGGIVLHWHGDTFELPDGAVHLASSALYENQAFSWGQSALALQFHAEAGGRGLERWFVGHAAEIGAQPGLSVAVLRADTARFTPAVTAAGQAFFDAWLTSVGL